MVHCSTVVNPRSHIPLYLFTSLHFTRQIDPKDSKSNLTNRHNSTDITIADIDRHSSHSHPLNMPSFQSRHPSLLQTYQERASLPGSAPLASYLLKLIAAKRTNLCVSADVPTTRELLQLAEEVGDSICLLKTHADVIQDFTERTMTDLRAIARKKNFLIFEDRKFGDIGSQYTCPNDISQLGIR